VVQTCQACQSIGPAPKQWASGEFCVDGTWQRVGMDITHFHGRHYLSLIDCGPSRYAAWRHLRRQDSSSAMQQLESVFLERSATSELRMDNDTAFRRVVFKRFLGRWAVRAHFRCAYVASGNGIVERCHRSVKRIAARMQCSIAEAVYWYNLAPKDGSDPSTALANKLYGYNVRVYGIDCPPLAEPFETGNPYSVGDAVWVKPPGSRRHTRFDNGTVTKVISDLAAEVDGIPRHIRDLRHAAQESSQRVLTDDVKENEVLSDDDNLLMDVPVPSTPLPWQDISDSDSEDTSPVSSPPRRSTRHRQPPSRFSP